MRALIAGADAIETGAQDYPQLVQEIPAAVEAALRDGRLSEKRLVDAGERTAALAPRRPAAERVAFGDAADRCVEVVGRCRDSDRPLVVECRPPGRHGVRRPALVGGRTARRTRRRHGRARGRRLTRRTLLRARQGDRSCSSSATRNATPGSRSLIAVTRRHPSAVVVDVGWPTDLDMPCVIRTRGVAPGLLRAAARALLAAA